MASTTRPVVVGIDGSAESIYAARWAADEAVGRDVPLRLVYVVRTDLRRPLHASQYQADVQKAKAALGDVRDAVEAVHSHLVVETDVEEGSPAGVLLAEAADAAMVCVGSSGIGRVGEACLGSTASAVAQKATCPVAVVRRPHTEPSPSRTRWIVIAVPDVSTCNEKVLATAAQQARLRECAVLAIGVHVKGTHAVTEDQLSTWVMDYRHHFDDVPIYPVSTNTTLSRYLQGHPEIADIVVVDDTFVPELRAILNAHKRSTSEDNELVVLVAR